MNVSSANTLSGHLQAGNKLVYGYGKPYNYDHDMVVQEDRAYVVDIDKAELKSYVTFPNEIPLRDAPNLVVEPVDDTLFSEIPEQDNFNAMLLAQMDGHRDLKYGGRPTYNTTPDKALYKPQYLDNYKVEMPVLETQKEIGTVSIEDQYEAGTTFKDGWQPQGADPSYYDGHKVVALKNPQASKFKGLNSLESGYLFGYNYLEKKGQQRR